MRCQGGGGVRNLPAGGGEGALEFLCTRCEFLRTVTWTEFLWSLPLGSTRGLCPPRPPPFFWRRGPRSWATVMEEMEGFYVEATTLPGGPPG